MSYKEYNFDKCFIDYWFKLIKPSTRDSLSHLQKNSRVTTLPKFLGNLRQLFWPLS